MALGVSASFMCFVVYLRAFRRLSVCSLCPCAWISLIEDFICSATGRPTPMNGVSDEMRRRWVCAETRVTYVDGRVLVEGALRAHVVVEDDDAHHHAQTEDDRARVAEPVIHQRGRWSGGAGQGRGERERDGGAGQGQRGESASGVWCCKRTAQRARDRGRRCGRWRPWWRAPRARCPAAHCSAARKPGRPTPRRGQPAARFAWHGIVRGAHAPSQQSWSWHRRWRSASASGQPKSRTSCSPARRAPPGWTGGFAGDHHSTARANGRDDVSAINGITNDQARFGPVDVPDPTSLGDRASVGSTKSRSGCPGSASTHHRIDT